MANTTLRKPTLKSKLANSDKAVSDAAALKSLRLMNIKHACEMYTGGGADALDQFRVSLGFILGTILVMPAELRAATTPEMLIKSVVEALDNTKTAFVNGEANRLIQMEQSMEAREAIVASESAQPSG